jgi:hypothetical protein
MRSYLAFVQPLARRRRSRLPLGIGLVIALMVSVALWGAAIWAILALLKIF